MWKYCTRIQGILVFCFFYTIFGPIGACYSNELPEGYRHQLYADQILNYRKIYDSIDQEKFNFSTTHIDGLFEILKNGFALVTDFIRKAPSDEKNNKEVALKDLTRLFNLSKTLENDKQLSQAAFIAIHLFMASIVDRLKGISQQNPILAKFTQAELDKIFNSTSPAMLIQKASFIHAIPGAPFVAIIYKGRTGILPSTFVAQLFDENKSMGLALFDVTNMPFISDSDKPDKPGSKKDPHYSKFNSTTKLLYHDLSHIREQSEKERYFWDAYQMNWQESLKMVNNLRNKLKGSESNAYKILTNGLFILSHELNNVIIGGFLPSSSQNPNFTDMINIIKESMKAYATTKRQTYSYLMNTLTGYKADHRDHEFILKDVKDHKNQNLLPSKEIWKTLDDTQKMKAVQNGYEQFWTLFLKIIKDNV